MIDENESEWYDPAVGRSTNLGSQIDASQIPMPSKKLDRKDCAMNMKGNITGLIPSKLILEITASYEDNFLLAYKNDRYLAEDAILRAITFAQAYFLHKSLGTKIYLKLVGKILYWPKERMLANGDSIIRFKKLLKESNLHIPEQATHVLFVSDGYIRQHYPNLTQDLPPPAHGGLAGGMICNDGFRSRVIVTRSWREQTMAKTMMHEIGHVLGMTHNKWWNKIEGVPEDYCIISKSSKYQSILRSGKKIKTYAWTICNRCDLLGRYQYFMLKGWKYCLAT